MPARKKSAQIVTEKAPARRRSKLAKDNNISAEKELEIKDAWHLFAEDGEGDYEDEKEGVLATERVQLVLNALGLLPKSDAKLKELLDVLDPDQDGFVTYEPLVAVAALQFNSRTEEEQQAEVDHTFMLFTRGEDRSINANDLKRVARELKIDISDQDLRGMILVANNGAGMSVGVSRDHFNAIVEKGAFS